MKVLYVILAICSLPFVMVVLIVLLKVVAVIILSPLLLIEALINRKGKERILIRK